MGKVEALAETERFSLVDFLLHLGELDRRRACEKTSYATIFGYLTRRLGFSESDAVRRVRVARAARKYPSILRMLSRGELHVVGISLLEPVLTPENHQRLLQRASRRSTREIDRLVAELAPACEPPRDLIRALPAPAPHPPTEPSTTIELLGPSPAPTASVTMAPAPPTVEPERRVVFTFTADEGVRTKFEQARDLLRHRFPMGRMEEVIGEALRRLVEQELPGKQRRPWKPSTPAKESRRIAKWIRNEVWRRDGGRCAYTGTDGARCGQTGWLEFDHRVLWALGGRSDDPANIRLLCRVHNIAEAKRLFGASGSDGR
ncbi:MAG: hypothetical protein A2V88_16840 [Elusimicrobia bacterium RBG_16_66_12]|nr:MAG: hypothetical protein A2V88_16840 [Elusimicrobia bacterium RBG_16_66_12]